VLGVRLTGSERQVIARAASRLCAGRYSRRRFLGAGGALAAALWVGCGRDDARRRPPSDAEVLSDLLRREQRTRGAVEGVAGADAIRRQDRLHAARLSALSGIAALDPRAASPDDLARALAVKQEGVFAYVEALPKLTDPDLRVLVMRIAASEAGHLAALRLADGGEPVPDAFAGYAPEDGA
jgi:hypothetical protein